MKRKDNLYNRITDIRNIISMYDTRVRVNTKNKIKIEKFDEYYVSNITLVKNILDSKNYKPSKYNIFLIREPKVRLIMSLNIIDKIINHLVCEYLLVDIFDSSLIDTNVATRVGKGTHYGYKKLVKYLNKNISKNLYILKFDIKKYFFNIDHDIVKRIIRTKIKDNDALNILDNIIDSTDSTYINKEIIKLKNREINRIKYSNCSNKDKLIKDIMDIPLYKKGTGFAIGNPVSQSMAILFLSYLDHYIKEELKIPFYCRYCDDGILISDNKEYLIYCLDKIKRIISEYKLELNINKTRIYSINEGFGFIGFKFIRKNNKLLVKIKNQTKRKFKRKLKVLNKLYIEGRIDYDTFNQVKVSYLGHLKYGNCNKLIRNSLMKLKDRYDDFGTFVKVEDYL